MSLKHIKLKIQSVKKTAKVTRAMEAVSAVKMRKAQERAVGARGYARAAMRILQQVSGALEKTNHPLVSSSHAKKVAIVIITSDKGLAGALNSSVLKSVQRLTTSLGVKGSDVVALCIGKRGYEFAQRRGFEVAYKDTNVSDDVSREQLQTITKELISLQMHKKIKEAYLVYTNFKSTFEQEAVTRKMLPLSPKELEIMVKGMVPVKGKYASLVKTDAKQPAEYLVEPDQESVMSELLPLLANIAVFHALVESKASEHSARMVAMKNATDKAKEVAQELTLEFNKRRQAAITAEVSEITSGIEAMK